LSDRYIKQQEEREKQEQQLFAQQQDQKQNASDNTNVNANENKDEKDKKEEEKNVDCVSVAPRMFKRLVGKEHPEFSTNKQQDVVEYFRHLLEFASRRELNSPLLKKI